MNKLAIKTLPIWLAMALPLAGCQTAASQISSSGTMGPTDAAFVTAAYTIAQLDERAGQLATTKATDPRVKDVAATMRSEAQVLYPNLQGALQAEHQAVPTAAAPDVAAEVQKLSSLSGAAFDKAFVADELAAHQRAVTILKQEDTTTKDAALKAQVEAELPAVQTNLDKLKAIASSSQPS